MATTTRGAAAGIALALVLLLPGLAQAGANIRKSGSIVAEIDGNHLRQRGSIVAEFDGNNVRRSGSIVMEFDGRYVRQRGSIVAEIDGRYVRKSGSIEWEIEGNGTVRRHGSIFYTVDGFTDSESMKRKVVAFLLLFAE
jgi:hypothetical protein